MKKTFLYSFVLASLLLTGCTSPKEKEVKSTSSESSVEAVATEEKITYLGQEYAVKIPTTNIITASVETMEDAAALNIQPLGAVTVGGEIPSYIAPSLGKDVANVGDKFGPNVELVTTLTPDVILGSTKFDDDVTKNLEKIAPTINVSHVSENWKDNLKLLGTLSGKEEEADKLIADYETSLKETKEAQPNIGDLKVVILRVRGGELCLYGENVYYNPMLYTDLGFKKPVEIDKVKGQETISVEQFSKINPDIVFVQFAKEENNGHENFIDNLKNDPIWQSMAAAKNDKVYYDIVDGGYQGGTYLSKKVMLNALNKDVLK
ncbi:iron-siderophore ABC transporter substrate-binding protein [Vagococcus fluvialis]|uniref:iron-siderophore ABC transporter substrate-binding protein n=1 Tax=Vagococcus fluvialis TaxID=2738 RepID=UPI001A8D8BE6|nr:iron-siderophore ABC transporter substrate-binding protein [Vagococcus fluvialis]MBO0437244.1 iron-siderophore ABC transporter substrate-binding protein [Vagococcus fluvialis]